MNHPFIPSSDPNKCARCRASELQHSDLAECEACPNIGPVEFFMKTNMLLCPNCTARSLEHQSPEKQEERVRQMRQDTLARSREIDTSIQSKPDYFNAETISISELKAVIDADTTVTDKNFILYEAVNQRYLHFKEVLIKVEEERLQVVNNMRADQSYLNQLIGSLTAEQQAKYKAQSINYKPNQTVTKPATPKKSKAFDKAELIKVAAHYKIPLAVLQTLCVSKNMTPEAAAKHYQSVIGG